MASYLTKTEMEQVAELKRLGILQPFNVKEEERLTKNGGIALMCGDGDIDAGIFHRANISERPHGIRVFGGPLVFASSFRGYNPALAEGLLENITWGMGAKKTKTLFLKPHWPCGVGKLYDHTMIDVINLMCEVRVVLYQVSDKVHPFFHVAKQFDDQRIEQNTYRLVLPESGIIKL